MKKSKVIPFPLERRFKPRKKKEIQIDYLPQDTIYLDKPYPWFPDPKIKRP